MSQTPLDREGANPQQAVTAYGWYDPTFTQYVGVGARPFRLNANGEIMVAVSGNFAVEINAVGQGTGAELPTSPWAFRYSDGTDWLSPALSSQFAEQLGPSGGAKVELVGTGNNVVASPSSVNENMSGQPIDDSYFSSWGDTANQSSDTPLNPNLWRCLPTGGGTVAHFSPTGDALLTTGGSANDSVLVVHNTTGIASSSGGIVVEHRCRVGNPNLVGAIEEWGVTNAAGSSVLTTGARAGFRFVDGVLTLFYRQPALELAPGVPFEITIPRNPVEGAPFSWLDPLDGTGPSGVNIALGGTFYTKVTVGRRPKWEINGITVFQFGLGGPFPSPVPDPASVRPYGYVKTVSPGAVPQLFFAESCARVLERAAFSEVQVNIKAPEAPNPTSISVASGTRVPLFQVRFPATLNGKPNPFNGILERIAIRSDQDVIIGIWLVVDTVGPGGFTAASPYPAGAVFAGNNPGYNDVPFSDVPGVAQVRFFPSSPTPTTVTINPSAISIDDYNVAANQVASFSLGASFDRARNVIGTCGDGASRSLLVTARRLSSPTATVSLVGARIRAIL